jgi:hypothetical protein
MQNHIKDLLRLYVQAKVELYSTLEDGQPLFGDEEQQIIPKIERLSKAVDILSLRLFTSVREAPWFGDLMHSDSFMSQTIASCKTNAPLQLEMLPLMTSLFPLVETQEQVVEVLNISHQSLQSLGSLLEEDMVIELTTGFSIIPDAAQTIMNGIQEQDAVEYSRLEEIRKEILEAIQNGASNPNPGVVRLPSSQARLSLGRRRASSIA